MFRTDDPIEDFNRWDAEREAEESLLPICSECGERIYDCFAYVINDEIICDDCMRDNYRKPVTDLMG